MRDSVFFIPTLRHIYKSKRRCWYIPTKTIRFNEKEEKILYDNWNREVVKELKAFLRKKLILEQKLKAQILDLKNSQTPKQKLLKANLEKLKYLNRQGISQETLDRISRLQETHK